MKKAFYSIINVVDIIICFISDIFDPVIETFEDFNDNNLYPEEKFSIIGFVLLFAVGLGMGVVAMLI
jgi:hypothetical protein